MNLVDKISRIVIVAIIAQFLLIKRFVELDVDNAQIIDFSLYYNFATIVLVYAFIKFKDPINPITLFVPFLYLLSYSFIRLSSDQIPLSPKTLLIIKISIFCYLLFASLNISKRPSNFIQISNQSRKNLLYFITIMGAITFLLECVRFGYVPIFMMFSIDTYNDSLDKMISFLHYFVYLLIVVPVWAYVFFKEGVISKKVFYRVIFVAIFVTFNYLSKQLILLFILSFFMAYITYNKFNTLLFLKGMIAIITLITIINFIRFETYDSQNTDDKAEFFRSIAGIEDDNVTLTEATFVEYVSKRYSAMEKMVVYSDKIDFFGFGMYTFRPILSLLLLEKTGFVERKPELNSDYLVGTYMVDPYLDFGLVGVVVLNSFYGFIANRFYYQFKNNRKEAIIKFAFIIQCMLMGMFINYFNTMVIWLCIFVNKILLGGLISRIDRKQLAQVK